MKFLNKGCLPSCSRVSTPTYIHNSNSNKIIDENDINMLCTEFSKSWKHHPTKQHLNSHLLLILQTIWERWTKHARLCRASKEKLINDILLWTPTHGHTSVDRIVKTYFHHCAYTECCLEQCFSNNNMLSKDWYQYTTDSYHIGTI